MSRYERLFLNSTTEMLWRGATIQTKLSLATTRIYYCTISPPLSGVMEDNSIVRV